MVTNPRAASSSQAAAHGFRGVPYLLPPRRRSRSPIPPPPAAHLRLNCLLRLHSHSPARRKASLLLRRAPCARRPPRLSRRR